MRTKLYNVEFEEKLVHLASQFHQSLSIKQVAHLPSKDNFQSKIIKTWMKEHDR